VTRIDVEDGLDSVSRSVQSRDGPEGVNG
jgi:hypothetical protein